MAYRLEGPRTPAVPRYQPVTPLYDTPSLPQSQSSSFNDSVSSQQSNALGLNRGHPSGSLSRSLRAATPATSLSNHSSQDQTKSIDHNSSSSNSQIEETRPVSLMRTSHPTYVLSQPPPSPQDHTSAPKRLANGEVKSGTSSLANSPVDRNVRIHSRTSSTASREGKAADLKARLAYMTYKLEHGYQDLKFSDVERIASQQGSPVSASSDRRSNTDRSPSIMMLSPQSTGQTPGLNNTLPRPATQPPHSPQRLQQPLSQNPAPPRFPSSYEDFWSSQSAPRHPRLAPPVDLQSRPANAYQSAIPHINTPAPPPTLQTLAAPSTPQRRPHTGIRSPSEQAASEVEAAEVLTLLSSPNHVGGYGYRQNAGSPLKPRVPQVNGREDGGVRVAASDNLQHKKYKKPMTEIDIERRLDEMSDSESESESEDGDEGLGR